MDQARSGLGIPERCTARFLANSKRVAVFVMSTPIPICIVLMVAAQRVNSDALKTTSIP